MRRFGAALLVVAGAGCAQADSLRETGIAESGLGGGLGDAGNAPSADGLGGDDSSSGGSASSSGTTGSSGSGNSSSGGGNGSGGSSGGADSGGDDTATSESGSDDSVVPEAGGGDASAMDVSVVDVTTSDTGASDSGQDALPCRNDLSNIGMADFQISFVVTTTQTGMAALVNQRGACRGGMFWDIRLWTGGFLHVETDDGFDGAADRATLTSTGAPVNDGRPHNVLVRRAGGVLTVYVDGTASGSLGSVASFGQLPPLQSAIDVCDGHAGTVAFVGTIAGVCATSP
jgi:hypothetical protein